MANLIWGVSMSDAKSAIIASMKQLIETHPYSSITVSDICENAYVSRKSFYNIFKNKEDVVSYIFKQDTIEPIKKLNTLFTQSQSFDMHMLFYEKMYEAIYESPAFYQKLIRPMRGKDDTFIRIATQAIYDLNIQILTKLNWTTDKQKEDYVSYFFAASQAMLIQKWVADGMPYTPHELAALYDQMTNHFWIATFGTK